MIAKLTGTIEYLKDSYLVLNVGNVGYQIQLTNFTMGKLAGSGEVSLHIFTYVREDTLALYGFLALAEKEMFELLISISGIGPKAAMGILSIAEPKTIRTAILTDDVTILTKVSGVGKKTAERVILELKNKVEDLPIEDREKASVDSEVIEALTVMGYSPIEAREALKEIPKEIKDIEGRIKMALKNLGK